MSRFGDDKGAASPLLATAQSVLGEVKARLVQEEEEMQEADTHAQEGPAVESARGQGQETAGDQLQAGQDKVTISQPAQDSTVSQINIKRDSGRPQQVNQRWRPKFGRCLCGLGLSVEPGHKPAESSGANLMAMEEDAQGQSPTQLLVVVVHVGSEVIKPLLVPTSYSLKCDDCRRDFEGGDGSDMKIERSRTRNAG